MSSQNQGNTLQDILKWEEDNRYSREIVTVASGQDLSLGAVIGKITKALTNSPSTEGIVEDSNAGTGTVTAVTLGRKAKQGTYRIVCAKIEGSPEEPILHVFDPDGLRLADGGIGEYESDHVNFTFADGSPADTAAGDSWIIVVGEGGGQVKAIDYDGVDGSQDAHGFVTAAVDATGGAVDAVAVVRDAVIVPGNLVWPDVSPEWTDDQKAAALAQLAARGIIARDEA